MAGAVGPTGLPKIQLMPTRISVMPITAIMVPVTTGGKQHAADGRRDQDGHHARADDGAEQLRSRPASSAVAMAAMGATEAR